METTLAVIFVLMIGLTIGWLVRSANSIRSGESQVFEAIDQLTADPTGPHQGRSSQFHSLGDQNQLARFESGRQTTLRIAEAMKVEYHRTLSDPVANKEIESVLRQFKDPGYIRGGRDGIKQLSDETVETVLPVLCTIFRMIADDVFPPYVSPMAPFGDWARRHRQKSDLVRVAYIVTVNEQDKAGAESPSATAMRVILWTLAANANDDVLSRAISNELLAYIDDLGRSDSIRRDPGA